MPGFVCELDVMKNIFRQILTVNDLRNTLFCDIDCQVGAFGKLIHFVDPREPFYLTPPCLSIKTMSVGLFAMFQWGSNVDQEEISARTSILEDSVACKLS